MVTLRVRPDDFVFSLQRHLFDVLAPRAVQADWHISPLNPPDRKYEWFEAVGEAADEIEAVAEANTRLTGLALATLAERVHQIIWGQFTGFLPGAPDAPWVTIRAIDSSFFDVTTDDEAVLGTIVSTFSEVETIPAP